MKGVVFTEFLTMVEEQFSAEMVEELIAACELRSGGAYTSIGTYDHHELVALVVALSGRTGAAVPTLVHAFGRHLCQHFTATYPGFFSAAADTLAFLERVEDHVHIEVRKLYPDAELPSFACRRVDADTLEMVYRSHRGFSDLAYGLIEACAEHYGEVVTIAMDDLSEGTKTQVRFVVHRAARAAS